MEGVVKEFLDFIEKSVQGVSETAKVDITEIIDSHKFHTSVQISNSRLQEAYA